ncbi:hypothetical protein HY500_04225 [Candidatus Woesearchaeota archaeon]|nr:hypothetical protein [Candidatus Woesearchaeota archaeon]MBI4159432.1 hypothetical protein [Candidatus Woesearchaeota archaeon]
MTQKIRLSNGELKSLKRGLIYLASAKLTKKQKQTLLMVSSKELGINATELVINISKELNCSQSTAWNNLRSLRNFGLIESGCKENKGQKVTLTSAGELINTEVNKNDI